MSHFNFILDCVTSTGIRLKSSVNSEKTRTSTDSSHSLPYIQALEHGSPKVSGFAITNATQGIV